jgi:hypothetical protein
MIGFSPCFVSSGFISSGFISSGFVSFAIDWRASSRRAARLYGLFPQVHKCSLFDSCIGTNADPFRAFRGKRIIFASPPALRAR